MIRSLSCSCCRGCSRLPVGLDFLHLERKGFVTQWGDVPLYNVPSTAEIPQLPWPKHGRTLEAVAFRCRPPNADLLPLFNSLNDLDHVNIIANVGPTDTGDPGIGWQEWRAWARGPKSNWFLYIQLSLIGNNTNLHTPE